MDEFEFDRTRKAIKTGDMSDGDRRDMLNKFTGAGGSVQKERSLKKEEPSTSRGGRGGGGAGGSGGGGRGGRGGGLDDGPKLPSQIARDQARAEGERAARLRKMREDEEAAASNFFARFSIKLGCRLGGLTPYGQDMVNPGFMSRVNLEAKRALMECSIMGNDLFMSNPKTAKIIVKELDEKNPLYVELIERAAQMYDRAELSELTSAYNAAPSSPVPLDAIRVPMFSLLRKLYYMKAYQESYMIAVDFAIQVQQRVEKKQSALYAAKKKKLATEWKNLMNNLYYSFVKLAQRAEMKKAEPGSRLFEEMIGVVHDDKIGTRKPGQPIGEGEKKEKKEKKAEKKDEDSEEEQDEEEGEEEAEEKEESEEEKEYAYGMRLMQIHTLPALRRKHDPKGEMSKLNIKDKVFISYLFFKEFDEEYSFILTTPKVKLNVVYRDGRKVDYHQMLADTYEQIRPVFEMFKKYRHEAEEFAKVVAEGGMSANYVNHAKKASLLESRRGSSGREVRNQMKDYLRKVEGLLGTLKRDMRNEKAILVNPEDQIKFDLAADQKKRLNGKPVKQAIMEVFCYVGALAARIEDGDLFGGVLEMSDEEFEKSFPGAPAEVGGNAES